MLHTASMSISSSAYRANIGADFIVDQVVYLKHSLNVVVSLASVWLLFFSCIFLLPFFVFLLFPMLGSALLPLSSTDLLPWILMQCTCLKSCLYFPLLCATVVVLLLSSLMEQPCLHISKTLCNAQTSTSASPTESHLCFSYCGFPWHLRGSLSY